MKKLLFVTYIAGLVFSCQTNSNQPTLPPDTYQVNISAKGVYNGLRGHLGVLDQRRRPVYTDTAMVVNESMTFNGTIKSPTFRILTINGVEGNLQFVLEPGITNIEVYKDSIVSSTVAGSTSDKLYRIFLEESQRRSDNLRQARIDANNAKNKGDNVLYQELNLTTQEKTTALIDYPHEFVEQHPNEDVSLLLLQNSLSSNSNVVKLNESLQLLDDVINKNSANTLVGQNIQSFINQLEALENVNIGKIAPKFSAPTPDGDVLALNDVMGKATIVEFWASWCGPCRRENPNIVNVYNKYHDKGLEIIGISLDRPNQKQRWLDAIEKDNLTWHHVSNLQYFNDPVARLYNISSIPASFILDENGTIVAKKLRGKALEDQIASMLN